MGLGHDKPLVIYHSPCMDGFTAAWAIWLKHPDWEFHAGVHGIAPPDVTNREVYFVDFSYKRPVLVEMLKKAAHITVIDHHASAIADLKELDLEHMNLTFSLDNSRSGAALTWMAFHPGERMPLFVEIVEDRDLWKFALPNTRAICNTIFSHPYSFETWNKLAEQIENEETYPAIVAGGEAIERKQSKDILELTSKMKERMVIAGHDVWAVNLPYTFASDAGHVLDQGEPFAASYWKEPNGWYFSLRSDENGADVSEIAKLFGGGGHKHAAGFNIRSLDRFLATP